MQWQTRAEAKAKDKIEWVRVNPRPTAAPRPPATPWSGCRSALEERLSMARKDAQPIPEIWGDAWNPSVYRAKSGSTPAILGPTGLAQPCSCVKDR